MGGEAERIMLLRLTSTGPNSHTRGWYARTTNAAVRQTRQATTITNENNLDKLYRTHTRMMSTTVMYYQYVGGELSTGDLQSIAVKLI